MNIQKNRDARRSYARRLCVALSGLVLASACDQPSEAADTSGAVSLRSAVMAPNTIPRHAPGAGLTVSAARQKTDKLFGGLQIVAAAEPDITPPSVVAGVAVWQSLSPSQKNSVLTGTNTQGIVVPTWGLIAVAAAKFAYDVGKDYNLWGREPEDPEDPEEPEEPETPDTGLVASDFTYLSQLDYAKPNDFALEVLDDAGFDY